MRHFLESRMKALFVILFVITFVPFATLSQTSLWDGEKPLPVMAEKADPASTPVRVSGALIGHSSFEITCRSATGVTLKGVINNLLSRSEVRALSAKVDVAYLDCMKAEANAQRKIISKFSSYEPQKLNTCQKAARQRGLGYAEILSCLETS